MLKHICDRCGNPINKNDRIGTCTVRVPERDQQTVLVRNMMGVGKYVFDTDRHRETKFELCDHCLKKLCDFLEAEMTESKETELKKEADKKARIKAIFFNVVNHCKRTPDCDNCKFYGLDYCAYEHIEHIYATPDFCAKDYLSAENFVNSLHDYCDSQCKNCRFDNCGCCLLTEFDPYKKTPIDWPGKEE